MQNKQSNLIISQRISANMAAICLLGLLNIMTGVNANLDQTNKYLIGVHPSRRQLYELSIGKKFKCIDGSGFIPIESVNDNYCDCNDASDEPGTSACIHGQFYCPNEGYMARLIPSAWVNDGQCDCCDASDEYGSPGICENTCSILGEEYRREQERYQETANQGSAIRSQYKQQAKERKEQNTQLLEQYKRELVDKENAIKKLEEELNSDFGPSNVFFPLKGNCYSYKDREYTYTLCPFERATQESTSGMQMELGRWSSWAGPPENIYSKQKYEGGIQCWNGPARSTLVNIACGVEDKITMVTEPAKCEYVYDFITPAACPDTDPPTEDTSEPTTDQTEPQDFTSDGHEHEEESVDTEENRPEETSGESEYQSAEGEKHDEL